jgi:hypothetical protein
MSRIIRFCVEVQPAQKGNQWAWLWEHAEQKVCEQFDAWREAHSATDILSIRMSERRSPNRLERHQPPVMTLSVMIDV